MVSSLPQTKGLIKFHPNMGFLLAFDFSRVLIRFHPNSKFFETKVGKTPNVQEKHGILPLRLDSWFNCKVKEFGLEETLTNPCIRFMYGL